MTICSLCGEPNPDKARFCLECGTKLQATTVSSGEARKTVTIVFSDLVGSTALAERLDSESVREVMDRYFAEMRRVLEGHGGIVEKFIGDAVMAVFGLPRAHEDDALRAVRAAYDMTRAMAALNVDLQRNWGVIVANRTGVNTGEVVVGDSASAQRLATGDVVNVAARLEQAAVTNQVLIGDPTYRLVGDAVDVEAIEPLTLKGKSQRVLAYRLTGIKQLVEGNARRLDAPLTGRGNEIRFLNDAFQAAVRERACHLVTVEGEAGVGKSRLLKEMEDRLRTRATLLRGRCLSYGEGITFWPLAEVIRQGAQINDEDSNDSAREKLAEVLTSGEEKLTDQVASLLGLSSASYPLEDSLWAVAKFLESIAEGNPLIVIFEDIHWAEETFLDLVERVVRTLHDVPCLVVCTARSELRETRSEWGGSNRTSSLLRLDPLSGDQSEALIAGLLGEVDAAVYPRVAAAAQGNPLYLEQIISMWVDDGTVRRDNGRWVLAQQVPASIPPTISALLAARLDRLDREDRAVIGAASVIGDVFYQGAVQELCPADLVSQVAPRLTGLIAKELIRPDRSTFVHEQTFSFRHVLVRNAAYDALLKRTRAALHEHFASWLENVSGGRVGEYEEILGYHLEQAHRYLESLGPLGEQAHDLGSRAARYLSNAGRRAMDLGDFAGAANLLHRAQVMLPQASPARIELLCDLGEAQRVSGQIDDANAVLREARELARAGSDRRLQTKADLSLINIDVDGGGSSLEDLQPRAEEAVQILSELPPSEELAHAAALLASIHWRRGELQQAASQFDEVADLGRRAGSLYAVAEGRRFALYAMWLGPHHVDEILRRGGVEVAWARDQGTLRLLGSALCVMAMAEAVSNHFDTANELLEQIGEIQHRLGSETILGDLISDRPAVVELLAGHPERAEARLRPLCRLLEERGLTAYLKSSYALLGESLYAQARYAESERVARQVQQMATSHDLEDEIRWRKLLAKAMARGGHDGEPLARAAVGIAEGTDMLNLRADALSDLAKVLDLKGRREEARRVLEAAESLYAQKGNVVSTARIRRLSDAPPSQAGVQEG